MMNPYEIDIPTLDEKVMKGAWARQDALAKPPRSLGVMEEISVRFAGMTGKRYNDAKRRRILIFAADNGVVEEGVTSAPQSVTLAQTINFTRGLTGVAVLAKHYNTELKVVDVGVNARFQQPGVIDRKIAMGTRNLAKEHAMTREQALEALNIGYEMAAQAAADGVEILGIGEMGIGNTTTSSAILSCLLNLPAEETTGRGGGVNDAGFARKKEIIDSAIARWKPDPKDVVDVLSKVGGFDIAAMCGAFLGAAANRLPVVIDGYISAVAALCAYRIRPASSNYFFGSHISCERGYLLAMNEMGVKPMFQLEMRLGEGSGCPIAFEVIDGALSVLKNMATFDEARIDDGYLSEIRSDAHLQR